MIKSKAAPLLLVLLLLFSAVSVCAVPAVDGNTEVGLNITYEYGDTKIAGAPFDIYLIAEMDSYGTLNIADDFKDYPINFNGIDNSNWSTSAFTLQGYILRDKPAPYDSGATDPEGKLHFPTEGKTLKQGLYLVMGRPHSFEEKTYQTEAVLVQLPGFDPYHNQWIYEFDMKPKPFPDFEPDEIPETITRKVLKVWKDENHTEQRPKEITVQLLRDGVVHDTIQLNAANNWRYEWTELEKGPVWNLVELKVDQYTAEVELVGVTFKLTNTYQDDPPDDPPDDPHKPHKPVKPDPPKPPTPSRPNKPSLPQTGQLWWPVPVLFAVGLVFVLIGLLRRRGGKHE